MMKIFKPLWWTIGLRGLLLLMFGIIAVTAPNMTVQTLMMYLGVMFGGVGIIQLLAGFFLRNKIQKWWQIIPISLVDLSVAFFATQSSNKAAIVFTYIIGFWALLIGVAMLYLALRSKELKIFLYINCFLSLGFGIVILTGPFNTEKNLHFIVGFYTILLSFFVISIAFKLFRFKETVTDNTLNEAASNQSLEEK